MREMVQRAIDSYLSQDYANRELIVVDDGGEVIRDLVEGIENCQYILCHSETLSLKRNVGCQRANGEFIVHFDADDWSGPHRITDQVGMMLANPRAQIGGYSNALWYDFVDAKASYYKGTVWGASLIYRRSYALENPWDERAPFGEDGPFIEKARLAQQIASGDGSKNFVATMHSKNARRAAVGTPGFWPFVGTDVLPEGFKSAAGIA